MCNVWEPTQRCECEVLQLVRSARGRGCRDGRGLYTNSISGPGWRCSRTFTCRTSGHTEGEIEPVAQSDPGRVGILPGSGIAAAGVVTYLAYRVKHKIEEAKTEYGLDKLGKLAEKASGSSGTVQARDVCSLLSKQEVSEITGVAITDATRCVSCSCR